MDGLFETRFCSEHSVFKMSMLKKLTIFVGKYEFIR